MDPLGLVGDEAITNIIRSWSHHIEIHSYFRRKVSTRAYR